MGIDNYTMYVRTDGIESLGTNALIIPLRLDTADVRSKPVRTIAKSFHTVESVPSPSIPRKLESTVSTLEFCCLRGGRRESNNFAIVL